METLIVKPKTQKQLAAVKAVLSALDISFKNTDETVYDETFVSEINQAENDIKTGKGIHLLTEDLWK